MGKGEQTRAHVLKVGLDLASESGLEALSIGALAQRASLSKSGLYAHFSSKEDLQCQVLDAGAQLFVDEVMVPAVAHPRGRPRLEAIQDRWMRWETDVLPGGCPFISAAADYDDREGPVRDRAVHHVSRMVAAIEKAASLAVTERHFRADLDLPLYAFEMWSIILGFHEFARLLRRADAHAVTARAFASLNDRAAATSPRESPDPRRTGGRPRG